MSDRHDYDALTRTAADRYGFGPRASIAPFSLTENPTSLVQEDGREPAVVRIYRPGGRSAAEVRSELAWYAAVQRESGVPVPAALPAADGSAFVDVGEPDAPVYAVAYAVAPGEELTDEHLGERIGTVGELTARLHLHARGWTPPAGFARPRWDLETTLGDRPHWGSWTRFVTDAGERRQLERLDAVVTRRLDEWGEGPDRFGLIHADLRMTNVISEGGTTMLIDFEDCGFSWYLYDLGSTLTFCEGRPDVDELVASWVDGYRRVAPLSVEDERALPTFLMLRRLLVCAYLGLRFDTELAAEAREAGYATESCEVAERYLSTFA